MLEILEHTFFDSIKLVPFLFLTYLIMEYLEHKAGEKTVVMVQKAGKMGPVIGGIAGAFPQCGFSAAATNLYSGKLITLGTLLAIYLSTSDEMLPILISEKVSWGIILKILCMKVIIGIIAGFIIDAIFKSKQIKKMNDLEAKNIHTHDHCQCNEEKGILRETLRHTFQITLFILLTTFVLNIVLHNGGEEVLAELFLNRPLIGQLIAGIIGLIPNCAASVVITQLYLEEAMSLGAMMTGLLVGAGVGILVLFRENKDKKDSLKVVGLLYIIGVISGLLIEWMQIQI